MTTPPAYPSPSQPVHKSRSVFSEFWYIFLFAFALVAITIGYILQALTPPSTETYTWNEITPGQSNLNDLTAQMGQPIGQEAYGDGQKLSYTSDYPTLPQDVILDSAGTVQFIKQYLPPNTTENIDDYIAQFGEPDYVLFDTNTGDSYNANVFLQQGVVVFSHFSDGSVNQKWYFQPTTPEIFFQSWGSNLTDEEEGPERLIP